MPSTLESTEPILRPQSWTRRNWRWVAPLGCLTAIALLVGLIALLLYLFLANLKASQPYRHAVQQATRNLIVQQTLGTPVEPAFFATGSVRTEDSTGEASLAIPLSGPNGDAIVFVEAEREEGEWSYTTLMVEIDETRQRINLLPPGR